MVLGSRSPPCPPQEWSHWLLDCRHLNHETNAVRKAQYAPSVSRGLTVKEFIFYRANLGFSDDIEQDLKLSAVDY